MQYYPLGLHSYIIFIVIIKQVRTLDGTENNGKASIKNMPDNLVIIAGKAIEKYAFSILLLFENRKEITLSANLNHSPVMERLISLYKVFGIQEMNREREGNRIKVLLAR